MLVRNGEYGENSFKIECLPTGTEVYRIKHTIEMLKKSERKLIHEMQKIRSETDQIIKQNCRQHILEILWGWQDLKRWVDTLSDSFVDKHLWREEIINGLKRNSNLYKKFFTGTQFQTLYNH
jgi:hypothetical protein